MSFRNGSHPESWPLSAGAEDEFARNDILAARAEAMKALKTIDGEVMPRHRGNARPHLLQAVAQLDCALEAMERER